MPPPSAAEQSPLLSPDPDAASAPGKPSKTCHRPGATVVLPCLAMLLITGASAIFFTVPANQIAERIICQNLYGSVTEPLRDPRCKNEDVQAELSLLNAMETFFDLLLCVICVVPFGMAADTYGRKPVLILNQISGMIYLTLEAVVYRFPHIFPIRLIWFIPILQFIGGGASTSLATIYSMICDVTNKDQRSSLFYYASAAQGLGSLLAGPLTYFCMRWGDWFTLSMGLMSNVLLVCVACMLRETLPYSQTTVDEAMAEQNAAAQPDPLQKSLYSQMMAPFFDMVSSFYEIFWKNKSLALLLISAFCSTIGTFLFKMILNQYVAKRFSLTWAEANLVFTTRTFIHFSMVLVALPALEYWLTRRRVSAFQKGLWVVRISPWLACLGLLTAGLANSLPLFIASTVGFSLGDGLEPALRSFSIAVAGPVGTGVLFSVLGLLQALGSLVSGPLMAATFKVGLHHGGVLLGLPLFVGSALIGVSALILLLTRFKPADSEHTEGRDRNE